MLPHIEIESAFTALDNILKDTQESRTRMDFPGYLEHSVRLEAIEAGVPEENIRPAAIYWDGVVFTRNESFLGVFFEDMKTRRNWLCCIIRQDHN